jgi:hypothetical protein
MNTKPIIILINKRSVFIDPTFPNWLHNKKCIFAVDEANCDEEIAMNFECYRGKRSRIYRSF